MAPQVKEQQAAVAQACATFENYSKMTGERTELFSNFLADGDLKTDRLDKFKEALLRHLSMTIVVKESRQRYQKEQFDRLVFAQNAFNLKSQSLTLDAFCEEYCRCIEFQIDKSHDFKSPKIRANYDDFEEATIRPMNSVIF